MTTAITLTVDDDTLKALDELAELIDRPRSWVLEEAVKRYLADEASWAEKLELGADETERDDVIPQENVMQAMRALIRERRRDE